MSAERFDSLDYMRLPEPARAVVLASEDLDLISDVMKVAPFSFALHREGATVTVLIDDVVLGSYEDAADDLEVH